VLTQSTNGWQYLAEVLESVIKRPQEDPLRELGGAGGYRNKGEPIGVYFYYI